jgi:hypothetical protein
MKKTFFFFVAVLLYAGSIALGQTKVPSDIVITKDDLAKVGTSISASSIGEPVGSVKLYEPRWIEATETSPAYGVVEGSIFPVDPNGWPINFRVLLPASWSFRSMQAGGGGMNNHRKGRKESSTWQRVCLVRQRLRASGRRDGISRWRTKQTFGFGTKTG